MRTIRLIGRLLPWVLVVVLMLWVYTTRDDRQKSGTIINRSAILYEVESLGKLELVRYNFKEITEVKEISKEYFRLFKLGPDSKIALISEGHAVGCIDLTKLSKNDILIEQDTLYLKLPAPEICYYKLDMENTRIYFLETNPLKDEKLFIQKAYKHAEREIRDAALKSGLLEQTRTNAELILKPMLETWSGKKVVLLDQTDDHTIEYGDR